MSATTRTAAKKTRAAAETRETSSRSIEERINTALRVLSVIVWTLHAQGPENPLTTDELCGCGDILELVTLDLAPIATAPFAVTEWRP